VVNANCTYNDFVFITRILDILFDISLVAQGLEVVQMHVLQTSPLQYNAKKQVWETILQVLGQGTGVLVCHQWLETLSDECQ